MSHFSGHFGPLKMSLEMAHKVIVPQKKIMSRSFLNSRTFIVSLGHDSGGMKMHQNTFITISDVKKMILVVWKYLKMLQTHVFLPLQT
jgi:hypothetical protein